MTTTAASDGAGFDDVRVHRVAGFPRLGWCARVEPASGPVEVMIGDLVETGTDARGSWWFAGVWDAPFVEGGFDRAATVMGSGGRVAGGELRVCGPSHLFDNWFMVEIGDRRVLGNCLPLCLAVADARLDRAYRWYRRDIARMWRGGTDSSPARVPLADDATLAVHSATSLRFRADGSTEGVERPGWPAPEDFTAYRDLLAGTVARLVANGGAAERRTPLGAATTLSSGYDTSAITVLGAEAGIRDAFTVEAKPGARPDDGAAVARALDLRVSALPRAEWRDDPDHPELTFAASCGGPVRLALAGLATRASGSLVLLGNWGDDLWERGPLLIGPDLAESNAGIHPAESTHELGIRAGIAFVPVPTIGATHAAAIHRITHAEEMEPWSVGGRYDRPIPRRIVEDVGVERDAFGIHKMVGAAVQPGNALSDWGRADFDRFWADLLRELGLRPRTVLRVVDTWAPACYRILTRVVRRIRRRKHSPALRRWEFERAPRAAYRFHWAIEALMERDAACLRGEPGPGPEPEPPD